MATTRFAMLVDTTVIPVLSPDQDRGPHLSLPHAIALYLIVALAHRCPDTNSDTRRARVDVIDKSRRTGTENTLSVGVGVGVGVQDVLAQNVVAMVQQDITNAPQMTIVALLRGETRETPTDRPSLAYLLHASSQTRQPLMSPPLTILLLLSARPVWQP